MKIEIFGSAGCQKCNQLKQDVEEIVGDLGLEDDTTVTKVEDPAELAKKGIMSTPALAKDGEVLFKGRVPTDEEIKEQLR